MSVAEKIIAALVLLAFFACIIAMIRVHVGIAVEAYIEDETERRVQDELSRTEYRVHIRQRVTVIDGMREETA